ncbi:MAG: HD-GYP domain-containing protein [Chloroflexi bacterium]|nr:HD-GYP domain-containing protein [Chloroflexota bacterium]
MQKLPIPLQTYIIALFLISLVFVGWGILTFPTHYLLECIFFIFLVFLADLVPIKLEGSNAAIMVSASLRLTSVLLFPVQVAILVAAGGTLAAEIILKRPIPKLVFNFAQLVIIYAAQAILYSYLSDSTRQPLRDLQNVLAISTITICYYLLNTTLVSAAIGMANQVPLIDVWRENFRSIFSSHLALIPIGVAIAMLWQVTPFSILLFAAPLLIARESFKSLNEVRQNTLTALSTLADVVDSRDSSTYQHSQRVADYSRTIARQLRLSRQETELIVRSARLHDLGKVGIQDASLYKNGPLTPEEQKDFQRHAALGADIIARIKVFQAESGIILHHHEWMNGKGYPDGIRQDDIPLGSRIISVADAFDAMTSDRPYRKAMAQETAYSILAKMKGTQFDPQVVEAMGEVLKERIVLPDPTAPGEGVLKTIDIVHVK